MESKIFRNTPVLSTRFPRTERSGVWFYLEFGFLKDILSDKGEFICHKFMRQKLQLILFFRSSFKLNEIVFFFFFQYYVFYDLEALTIGIRM
jgi:hypothetical protein